MFGALVGSEHASAGGRRSSSCITSNLSSTSPFLMMIIDWTMGPTQRPTIRMDHSGDEIALTDWHSTQAGPERALLPRTKPGQAFCGTNAAPVSRRIPTDRKDSKAADVPQSKLAQGVPGFSPRTGHVGRGGTLRPPGRPAQADGITRANKCPLGRSKAD
jgi:hypothetical protein